ncbi:MULTISPECIES: GAF domain-containing protein [Pseudomonas]|uniref:GAF domain-containing protein n=1 Tax=Pseudomonas quercus TaxID=2722792 RepID=A0ABX0YF80_9PSED|nr:MULTISPECIES: GAF domain-containing protein [Pseudomonas]MBF7143039.1 GAF domain-containing protein [Pseudomonas sp. LY10J]NJP01932.1 GAF domain-containing protein [Pseudomonas quercus]
MERLCERQGLLTLEERSAIAEIEATTHVLKLVTRLTGMGFAGISKFTDTQWVVCSVYDAIGLGIAPGESLDVETTLCHELQRDPRPLFLANIANHPRLAARPVVAEHRLGSYAGVPVILPDGTLYGALCALDTKATAFDDENLAETLELFARLIGCIFYANIRR